ncbi:MAG: gliding motility-associated ABC transporter permease subunit GldF [Chitinophagales bacterium]|nr:gliding motility-associated ABC transporter permease subunit GldF [Chitinophagales bacterium]MDW8428687.1 gliding motility-associated ABC transporter permease subunit GldF [Chitinophagales bacterium]
MMALFRKELISFYGSAIGYVATAVFLILIGLVVWVFPGNLLDYGYASLEVYFDQIPVVLLFLVPAVTMRLFAEEIRSGTLELLLTRPLNEWSIVMGKYLAALTVVLVSLAPTLLYYYSIAELSAVPGDVDHGAILGSYFGLILLSAVFAAVGLFASALTENQIIAFVLAAFLNFLLFAGMDAVSSLMLGHGALSDLISQLGIQYHYASMSRGVIDTRDVYYFVAVTFLFLFATVTSLRVRRNR